MKKKDILLWIPAFSGVLLLLVSYFDMQQFDSGSIAPKMMLNREIPLVILGFLSSLIMLIIFFLSIFKKNWFKAIQLIISIFVYFICFCVGGVWEAAYLYAT